MKNIRCYSKCFQMFGKIVIFYLILKGLFIKSERKFRFLHFRCALFEYKIHLYENFLNRMVEYRRRLWNETTQKHNELIGIAIRLKKHFWNTYIIIRFVYVSRLYVKWFTAPACDNKHSREGCFCFLHCTFPSEIYEFFFAIDPFFCTCNIFSLQSAQQK